LTHEMVLLLLVNLLEHLLLMELVGVEHGMTTTLALRRTVVRILDTHLVTSLRWYNTALAALHLNLSWKWNSCSSCCRSRSANSCSVGALRLVELDTTELTWYLIHDVAVITVWICEALTSLRASHRYHNVILVR